MFLVFNWRLRSSAHCIITTCTKSLNSIWDSRQISILMLHALRFSDDIGGHII